MMEINVEGLMRQVVIPMGTLEVYKELIKTLDAEEVEKIIDCVMNLGSGRMLEIMEEKGKLNSIKQKWSWNS